MLGATEILIISGVVVLLFGATAIPKIAKSIGQARREFNKGLEAAEEESNKKGEKRPQADENKE